MTGALSRFRQWWPELLCGGLLVLIANAGGRDDLLFAMFTGIVLAVGWGFGYRHRMLPLHQKVDNLTDGVHEVIRDARSGREETQRPRLYGIRGGKDSA